MTDLRMDVAAFLDHIAHAPAYDGQLVHVERLPARQPRYAVPDPPLPAALDGLLSAAGIEQLYTHQVASIECARTGSDLVLVSGTASGKTLAYNLPILEACLADPEARALYLYPTKALAQDQLKGLLDLLAHDRHPPERWVPGVYDGDTPQGQRRRIKAEANLVLSNPDMLHVSILPYHPKWARFLAGLRYVVLDEVHNYRGILGANVACVLRRLQRVCRHYGSDPVFLAASATIANPGELTSRLVGREVQVIDDDGAPRGRKFFALWNPRPLGKDHLARRSATDDAVYLMAESIENNAQTLAFTRTRQSAELVHRYVRQRLEDEGSSLAAGVQAYRGGYLPARRREIEQSLFSGRLRGVASTNALELGVDVGSLDVVVLTGYPGTIASTWQQAGRSGRRNDDSLAVLVAGNDPIDQYLLRHPGYFFGQSPEHAVVDPENPYVLSNHLKAAAFELPLDEDDYAHFGAISESVAQLLTDDGQLSHVAGRRYFSGGQNPATGISLRHMSDNTFSIVERKRLGAGGKTNEVIANVDAISAPELIYPQAIYLHDGQPYFVRELDLDGKVAYVERRETDYYTQAILESKVRITAERQHRGAPHVRLLAYGDVEVSWQTVAFKKIKFDTRENIGMGPVDIPAQSLDTTALWLVPDDEVRVRMKQAGWRTSEGLVGLRNLAIVALPMVAMCDSRDISGVVDSQNLGTASLILYDRYRGGLGYCQTGFHHAARLLEIAHQMVAECACDDGCPSCVGLPNLRPAIHHDPDLSRGYPMPNKVATLRLLELLRGTCVAAGDAPVEAGL